jgi:hypothetical protein
MRRVVFRSLVAGATVAAVAAVLLVTGGGGEPAAESAGRRTEAAATPAEGAMCRVDEAPEARPSHAEAMARIQSAILAGAEDEKPVVLNGRGYNYPSASGRVDPSGVEREARLQR